MISLGVDAGGQKTPPNSPATPFESGSSEAISASGGGGGDVGFPDQQMSETTSPIAVGSSSDHVSANFGAVGAVRGGSRGAGDAMQIHNLELIRQQMMTNEFVRATGYPQDQAVRILAHFKWDYEAAVSDFFDEVKVVKQNSNSSQASAFPPHNTPLTPPAFPSDMTLSFNHLFTTDSPNSSMTTSASGNFNTSHINNSAHYFNNNHLQHQISLNSGMEHHHLNHLSSPPPSHNNNNHCDLATVSFSPLAGASSPIQYQRTISGSSFQSSIPFPMEIGTNVVNSTGLSNSTCSTPSSTGSFASNAGNYNPNKSPFVFQTQMGAQGSAFGCQQGFPSGAGGGHQSFTSGAMIGNQMEYRCTEGIKMSDSLESME
ncbi:uncharacterized protein LOC142348795 isoform X2 [Convolutriloba macropyga]|uniref:uncharacterized protein LOC142348795 isoform X2 n=1 Tax=Convolutriloba macropyga TaxID=536237 RepID=UPI003F51B7B0